MENLRLPHDQDCHEMWSKELRKRKRTSDININTINNINTQKPLPVNANVNNMINISLDRFSSTSTSIGSSNTLSVDLHSNKKGLYTETSSITNKIGFK
jgi:hypothetical protein